MVKPYCEDCGKHRASSGGYCCDAEAKRIKAGAIGFYEFVVPVIFIALVLKMLWLVFVEG